MKVNRCNSISFQGNKIPKKRFVSTTMQINAQELLDRMNSSTVYTVDPTGTCFTSQILASLKVSPDIKFTDERILISKIDNPELASGLCSLDIGNTNLMINSKSGEIIKYKKSIFNTWTSILSQAENCLAMFVENFNNNDIVEKKFFGIKGFTEKGLKQFEKAKQNINYYGKK